MDGAAQELIDSTKTSLQSLRATIAEEGGFAEQMKGLFNLADKGGDDARDVVSNAIQYLNGLQ